MKSLKRNDHGLARCPAVLRKYFFPLGLVFLCGFSLLAGCQLQNALRLEPYPTATNTETIATNALPTIEPTATAETTTATTTLVIWLPPQLDPEDGSPAGEILKARLLSFEQEHPQYSIEVRIKAFDGASGLEAALESSSSIAPSSLPAVVALPYSIMDGVANGGFLEPLSTDAFNANDPDWLAYAREVSAVDKVNYCVPFGSDALVLAYRPLVVPNPPQTWQGVVNQEQFVSFPAGNPDAAVLTQMYLSAGGALEDEKGNPELSSEPLQKSLEVLQEGAQRDVFPTWIAGYTDFNQSWGTFLNQQAYYAIIWSSQFLAAPKESISITTAPGFSEGPVTLIQGWSWCIPAYSTAADQDSLLLLEYLSDPAFANPWAQAAGYLPVRESGLESWRNHPDALVIMDLVRQDHLVPFAAPNDITTPLLEDATVQIILKQAYYGQLLDDIMGHFQVK